MSISRLVYISTAHPDLMLADLDAILETARSRNAAEGVTGLLLFNGFNFMQLLEGAAASVERVFASMCRDPRHSGVVRVLSGPAETRVFPDWAMAYARTGAGESAIAQGTDTLDRWLPGDVSPDLHMLFASFHTMSAFDGKSQPGAEAQAAP